MNINLAGITLTGTRVRIGILFFFMFILFSALAIQLWNMQVRNGERYQYKAIKQSARRIRVPAVRGTILDRNGIPIVTNRVSYNAQFHLSEMKQSNLKKTIENILSESERMAICIGRKNPLTYDSVLRHKNLRPGIPLKVFTDLNRVELGRIMEMIPQIKGLEIAPEPVREYPHGGIAAQVLGYVSSEDPAKAQDRADYFYYISDLIGRSGIEAIYNEKLKGSPGNKLVMVNSSGYIHSLLESPTLARNGFDLQLTLDINAQKLCEKLLDGYTGSMVVMNARNGEVLAMASMPTYNPRDFVPRISGDKFRSLNQDPRKPFLNRATMGSYLPGSIIKPLCGLAVLESGMDPETTVNCSGLTPHGYGRGIHCNNRYGHGDLDLYHALMKSCNVYFVNGGVSVGIDALSRMYASAGIGSKTGIELNERSGYLPVNSPSWKEEETAYVAFGQGKVEITPLQAACYFAAIGNGGYLLKPYLIKHIFDPNDGNRVSVFDAIPKRRGKLAASRQSLDIVKQGMYMVVHEPGGSGVRAKSKKFTIYGKTGTADVIQNGKASKNVWFAGFASDPRNNNLYSFALIVEKGVSGGGTAAPIIQKFFDSWNP